MPRAKVDEKLVQEMLGEDFFYEHGLSPTYKHFPQFLAQNSYGGDHPDVRTPYISDYVKKIPQRDIEDLLQRDLKLNTVMKTLPAFTLSLMGLLISIKHFRNFIPIGKYGVRNISQTNLYKAWGPLGVVGACSLPLIGFYQFKQVSSYFLRLCYERIILQERDWNYKRLKELDIRSMYDFLDTPLATVHSIDPKGKLRPSIDEACKRSEQAPLPLWFRDN